MTDNDGEPRESVGPYRVIRRLGAGGMGEVFLAYDPRLDRRVAIKRVLADAADDPEAAERRARFHREARVAAGLGHPAVAQVFDLLTVGGVDHLVMEHVPGESLRRVLGRRGALPVAEGSTATTMRFSSCGAPPVSSSSRARLHSASGRSSISSPSISCLPSRVPP